MYVCVCVCLYFVFAHKSGMYACHCWLIVFFIIVLRAYVQSPKSVVKMFLDVREYVILSSQVDVYVCADKIIHCLLQV
jgi:hypothetical protein